jgi:hypothetical protein
MKLGLALCFFLSAFAGTAATGCSSDSTSGGGSSGGTGGGSGIAPNSHDVNESCPDGVSDCKTGLFCDTDDPHGQCYMTCTPSMDSQCGDPAMFACNSEGHCYPRCTVTADCARASEGYVCKDDEPPRPPVKFCDGPN